MLTLRNDLLRGNIVYQGYAGTKMVVSAMKKPDPAADQPKVINYGGQQWQIVHGSKELRNIAGSPEDPSEKRPTFDPLNKEPNDYQTFLEFSASFGYSRFGNDQFSNQPLNIKIPLGDGSIFTFPANADTSLRPGWNVSVASTFNAHKHFAHEVGFTWNSTKLKIDLVSPISVDTIKEDADIRQFHYSLLWLPRPNGKRFQPFIAGGAGMQFIDTISLEQHGNKYLKYAFRYANILWATVRSAQDPPLEGGSIFQGTVNYGAGVKYHLTRRVVLRAEYRETLSAQPDFWTKSYDTLRTMDSADDVIIDPGKLQKFGMMRQQRFSLGVGVTF